MDTDRIIAALGRTQDARIIVFGDYCLDKYLYIDPKRDEPSVETGLTAYQVHRKQMYAGVGGTITNNLRALGAQVRCIGAIGCDGEGFELKQALTKVGADIRFMVEMPDRCTNTYTKPMRKQPDGSYQEMERLDFRDFSPMPQKYKEALVQALREAIDWADGVIITDQFVQEDSGVLTPFVREAVCALAKERPQQFFYADSRAFIDAYRNVMVKCNNHELLKAMRPGQALEPTQAVLEACGRELCARNGKTAFVTLGEKGSMIFDGEQVTAVPAFRVSGEIDIVGAGDATNAGIMLGLCLGLKVEEAALLGNCVSSITIQQIGTTGTASPQQVARRLKGNL